MKPTQQEIIELARDAGIVFDERAMPYYERLVHLALERFGAGGGEHAATAHVGWACWGGAQDPNKDTPALTTYEPKFFSQRKRVYTHPSPTDLRAEYERGVDDAARVAADDAHVVDGRGYYDQLGDAKLTAANIRNAIEALKGKQ